MKLNREKFFALWLVFNFIVALAPPARGAVWVTNTFLNLAVQQHTATLLPNGKVLVCGGRSPVDFAVTNAALYDPATGLWTNTGSLNIARQSHTAVLLTNGLVLVAGGQGNSGALASAELYDPATGGWTVTGSLGDVRFQHTATLLPDGRVLAAGGEDNSTLGITATAELYNPVTHVWSATFSMSTKRYYHTATLLRNGKVLVVDGAVSFGSGVASAELYDPATGLWSAAAGPSGPRYEHTATLLANGQVLVAGGFDGSVLGDAQLYDPAGNSWSSAGSLKTNRTEQTATLLPNGKVLVAGGVGAGGWLTGAELYDPVTKTWSNTASLATGRYVHTATLLLGGQVLVAGGNTSSSPTNSVEVYDYANGSPTNTGAMSIGRYFHTATLLPDGKVLVAGGSTGPRSTNSTEVYDPANGTWTATGAMTTNRFRHTATLLPNGKVLVTGGYFTAPYALASTELYDPATKTWTAAGTMTTTRENHTATLLPNGKVLVAGGDSTPYLNSGDVYNALSSAELYDPAKDLWTATGSMSTNRTYQTATLLPNGKVLVTGGANRNINNYASAELYDPETGAWTLTGSMSTNRAFHTATLLPNGKVLAAGGRVKKNSPNTPTYPELYDPASGTWSTTGPTVINRENHVAILLPDGRVLIAGGDDNASPDGGGNALASVDVFNAASGTWTTNRPLNLARELLRVTPLLDGRILMTGGIGSQPPLYYPNAELYDPGLGSTNTSRPQIATVTSPLNLGGSLVVTGTQFRGVGEGADGGTQGSGTDYPLVQLRSLDGGQTMFLPTTDWGTNHFTSLPVTGFPPGYALATVFVNGIQSTSSVVNVSVPVAVAPPLKNPVKAGNGFQFTFTNNIGALFGVLATTNLSQPLTNWTALGGVTETSPGQFKFTDTAAPNGVQRYYLLYAP